jgi:hypothetical protein
MALFQRAVRQLSQEAGRPLSFAETLECLCAELLAGAAFPEPAAREQLEVQAQRDLAAEEAAPWAAVAAVESPCPGSSELQIVSAAPQPHWENPHLRFNGETRYITEAQRDHLLRRDGYQCSTPGCPNTLWLHVHHVVFYCEGGATVPDNLLTLCSACHRNIHRGWLRVWGRAPQGLEWRDAVGRRLGHVKSEPAEWLRLWFGDG